MTVRCSRSRAQASSVTLLCAPFLAFLSVLAGCETQEAKSGFEVPSELKSTLQPATVVLAKDPWTFESTPGVAVTTRHYRIHLSGDQPALVGRLPIFAEGALLNYRTSLTALPAPEARMETFVLANRNEWVRCIQMIWGAKAEPYLTIQRGGITAGGKSVLYDIGPRDTLTLAAHEGWHQYAQSTFQQQLPVWMDEGIATFMEGFRTEPGTNRFIFLPWANLERFDRLREAASADGLMTLRELMESSPSSQLAGGDALTWYAQVWALVHWLNEGDASSRRAGLQSMIQDAAEGQLIARVEEKLGPRSAVYVRQKRPGPELFNTYFPGTVDAANDSYQAFIRKVVGVGSREKVVAGKSPCEP